MKGDSATSDARHTAENVAMDRAKQALRLASASLPHLSGLARLVRVKATRRVAVAAVAASGLVLIHPDVFAKIPLGEAAFVLAHEMLHLALDTHGRQGDANRLLVNYAHDYIINDILGDELERDPPLDGLVMPGAKQKSLEELVVELSQGGGEGDLRCWNPGAVGRKGSPGRKPRSTMTSALEQAGLVPPEPPPPSLPRDQNQSPGDVLPGDREEEFEPEVGPQLREILRDQVRKAAAKAASLSELRDKMNANSQLDNSQEPQRGSQMMQAVRGAYSPPWELAMQRWIDSLAPGERTYARPSRRGADRPDLVRPGRRREGWTLHVLLDTSGSMVDILPRALGAIATFCEASNVAEVHIVQCDVELTGNVWVEPQRLTEFKITGFGYSDMSPGINHLAEDPEVQAALVLTDGYIDIPAKEPPYRVVWALIGGINDSFAPAYGEVIKLPHLQ